MRIAYDKSSDVNDDDLFVFVTNNNLLCSIVLTAILEYLTPWVYTKFQIVKII